MHPFAPLSFCLLALPYVPKGTATYLLSSAAGITDYLTDGENAIIFQSENAVELAKKMRYCIQFRDEVKEIGEKSYKIYEENFAMDVFEKNLLRVVEDAINI